MALFRKLFYRKPPDGLLEICDKVYVFYCCFSIDTHVEDDYITRIVGQFRHQFTDSSILAFNFRGGNNANDPSRLSTILSELDMTVMDYPQQYEGCLLLTMETINHFLRSCESWLSLGHSNFLLMHSEQGGWPVLAFMISALLLYMKLYNGEQRTLEMVYKQAPRELLHLFSPLNPIPSQLRYLQYVSRRNVGTAWPPMDRALTLHCVILRFIPNFDKEGGFRPMFKIYGQDPFLHDDRTPKLLISTSKISKKTRSYKQVECELVKIDINCHIQGDIVVEAINLCEDMVREEMMFRVMFNTTFIRSNILILNRNEIDTLWDAKDLFPKDFRLELLFSEIDAAASIFPTDFSCFEDKEGLPIEAFAKVQEMFNHVDWLDPVTDATLHMLEKINASNIVPVKRRCRHGLEGCCSPKASPNRRLISASFDEEELLSLSQKSPPHRAMDAHPSESMPVLPDSIPEQPSALPHETPPQPPTPPQLPPHPPPQPDTPPLQEQPSIGMSPHPSPPPPAGPANLPPIPPKTPPVPPPAMSSPAIPSTKSSSNVPFAPPPPPTKSSSNVPSAPPPPGPNLPSAPPPPALPGKDGPKTGSPSPPPFVSPGSAKGRGLSSSMGPKSGGTKKLKPLHWLKLSRAVQGSIWAEAQKNGEATKAPEIDMSELENLFSASAPASDSGRKLGQRDANALKPDKVQLIDHRRAYNCEIMLSKVKVPLNELMSSVLALEDSALDVDQVENLIKFCPTKEEIKLLKGYDGDTDKLGRCEQFFLELIPVPRVESKLRVLSFKMQFCSQVSDLRNSLNTINSAAEEVRGSVKFKRIMQTILSLGNALNQGTARGSAIGFRLDSVLKLTDTRARNNKMTLMHYLCKVLADKLPEVLDFSKDLPHLEPSSKVQLKFLAEEMQAISKGLENVVQELAVAENDGPISGCFCKILKEFLHFAEAEVRSLAFLYSVVGRNVDSLILYFGEDPARCPFEQVVSTLVNFQGMLKKAQEENHNRMQLEMKKESDDKSNMGAPKEADHHVPTPIQS